MRTRDDDSDGMGRFLALTICQIGPGRCCSVGVQWTFSIVSVKRHIIYVSLLPYGLVMEMGTEHSKMPHLLLMELGLLSPGKLPR